jgi:hypothetical protein
VTNNSSNVGAAQRAAAALPGDVAAQHEASNISAHNKKKCIKASTFCLSSFFSNINP